MARGSAVAVRPIVGIGLTPGLRCSGRTARVPAP